MKKYDIAAIFTLCLCLLSVIGCRDKQTEAPLFSLLTSSTTGITFKNQLVEKYDDNILRSEYFYNGGGVSAGDINNDGLADLYFVSNQGQNRLYLNQGNFKFKDITETAMVGGHDGWATASTMVDFNNDGYLDIYVSYSRSSKLTETANQLFINNKNLTFSEAAVVFGINDRGQTNQTAFLDYDLDGDLDMLVTNHLISYPAMNDTTAILSSTSATAGDRLYRNDDLRFTDVTQEAGLYSHALGFALGVGIGDLNQDGWPDIYIGNDFVEKDYLYLNNTDGAFIEKSQEAFGHISNFSMGNDIADVNNDGFLDIISLDMANTNNFDIKTDMAGMDPESFNNAVEAGFHHQYMYNTFQLNMGKGQFGEVAKIAGIDATDWSWAPLLADFDNDGFKDLFVTNGFRRNFRNKDFQKYQEKKYQSQQWTKNTIPHLMKDLLEHIPVKHVPNKIFKNKNGYTFSDMTKTWGMTQPSFSNGAAYADLDNDGDLDIVVNNIDEEAFVYRNNTNENSANHFLAIDLTGPQKNYLGLGAKVTLYTPDGQKQFTEHYMVRGYRSSVPHRLHFGLGNNETVDSVMVKWPDGKKQLVSDVKADQKITLSYADAALPTPHKATKPKIFETISASEHGITFVHLENDFDDFEKQVLLPHKYSQFGPGLAVADVNGDKRDDFFVGGAKGQPAQMYLQTTDGNFTVQKGPWQAHREREDVSALFFDADGDGDQDLYVVSGGNEWESGHAAYHDQMYLNNGKGSFIDASENLPDLAATGSKVRPCDFDRDGDLDLFVGTRLVAQQYPLPASGYLLRNDGGDFTEVTAEIAPELFDLGLITDALWKDIDGDGDTDLIVVGEWMPITIFRNEGGRFIKSDAAENGLSDTEGWWYSIAAADFDGDGDEDLVAGNLGQNYKYRANIEAPFEVYSSDFDQNKQLDIVLAFHEKGKLFPLRGRQCSSAQMPYIKKKYPTYEDFGAATVEDIVGKKKMSGALNLKAKTFASTYFENQGDGTFKGAPLPFLAQLSNVNKILVDDYDHDGNQDMVLVGNLYQSEVETPRNDAGFGVLLLGDGKGGFVQKIPYESGLYANGDVKEAARITLEGRQYLLIANNDAPLQLVKVNGKF